MEQSLQKLNQNDRLRLWTERVAACRSSGKQVRQWCRENGVNEKTYYYWQRRVYESAKAAAGAVFAEVIMPQDRCTGIAAVIHSGSIRVEIMNGTDSATVQAILSALSSC